MTPLVIYHANCADGFGAAFAAWTVLGDDAEYIPAEYDKPSPLLHSAIVDREVYILDFSFPRAIMDVIFEDAKRVVWLDHHKTAFESYGVPIERINDEADIEVDARHDVILNNDKSGAMLAWEYFHPDTKVPDFIRLIDDRDRWQFKLWGTKEFGEGLWSMRPWSFQQWEALLDGATVGTYVAEGAAILRATEAAVAGMMTQQRKCNIDSNVGLALNTNQHISDVGHQLAVNSGTYGLVWHVDKDLRVRCSLRSNGDYDVSRMAGWFGGGGHKNAAGFTTSLDRLMEFLDNSQLTESVTTQGATK